MLSALSKMGRYPFLSFGVIFAVVCAQSYFLQSDAVFVVRTMLGGYGDAKSHVTPLRNNNRTSVNRVSNRCIAMPESRFIYPFLK